MPKHPKEDDNLTFVVGADEIEVDENGELVTVPPPADPVFVEAGSPATQSVGKVCFKCRMESQVDVRRVVCPFCDESALIPSEAL